MGEETKRMRIEEEDTDTRMAPSLPSLPTPPPPLVVGKKVWVECPFAGETEMDIQVNILYASYVQSYIYARGDIPLIPILVYANLPTIRPQSVQETEGIPEDWKRLSQRYLAGGSKMWRNFDDWKMKADIVTFAVDLGKSTGMMKVQGELKEKGMQVEEIRVKDRLQKDLTHLLENGKETDWSTHHLCKTDPHKFLALKLLERL